MKRWLAKIVNISFPGKATFVIKLAFEKFSSESSFLFCLAINRGKTVFRMKRKKKAEAATWMKEVENSLSIQFIQVI